MPLLLALLIALATPTGTPAQPNGSRPYAPLGRLVDIGLRDLARSGGATFIDCSDVFATERATTFTDLWHFADPGHALLADRLAPALLEMSNSPPQGAMPTRRISSWYRGSDRNGSSRRSAFR